MVKLAVIFVEFKNVSKSMGRDISKQRFSEFMYIEYWKCLLTVTVDLHIKSLNKHVS